MSQTIEIKSYAERRSAVQEHARVTREQGEAEIRKLKRQQEAVSARVESQLASLERSEAAYAEQRADAIAAEFGKIIAAHVAAWIDEPSRKGAIALAEVYRGFDARAVHELGDELWPVLLASAFAAELVKEYPSAVNVFGQPWSSNVVELCGGFRRALDAGPALIESALVALESHMQKIAASVTGEPSEGNARRLELKRSCATHGIASRRQGDFDREVEKRSQEAFARTYVPPETLRERAMRMLGS